MAHYVAFLSTINHCAFFTIASCFARLAEISCPEKWEHSKRLNSCLILSSYLHLQFPTLLWLSITNGVKHFALNLLIATISNSSDQMSYFYELMRPGKLQGDTSRW